jgi:hypothetical protein
VPAAAVIPAPIAYIKVVAVKKLVVGFLAWGHWPGILVVLCCRLASAIFSEKPVCPSLGWAGDSDRLL